MPDVLIAAALNGGLTVGVSDATNAQDCACTPVSPSAFFTFGLQPESAWGDAEASSRRTVITSPDVFVSLAMPSVGADESFLGRFFYFRSLERDVPFMVRLDYADSTTTDVPVNGLLVIEIPEDDELTAVSCSGTGAFEWCVVGRVVTT